MKVVLDNYCRKCDTKLIPEQNWNASNVKKNNKICKYCIKIYNEKYNEKNKERLIGVHKRCREKRKNRIDKDIILFRKQWNGEVVHIVYCIATERVGVYRFYNKHNKNKNITLFTGQWDEERVQVYYNVKTGNVGVSAIYLDIERIKEYEQSEHYKNLKMKWRRTEKGKKTARRNNQSDAHKKGMRKVKARRDRDFGYVELFDNIFDEQVEWHHITDVL